MTPTRRVLVVDDSPTSREIYATFLRNSGIEVAAVADGPSALEAVEADRPDAVVLDLMLPGMDGFEVLRELGERDLLEGMAVICVTAALSDEYRQRALKLGCSAFLEKPDSPRRIVETVQRLTGPNSNGPRGS